MELPMKSKLVIFSLLTFWMFMGNFSFAQKGHDSISKIQETYNDTLGKRDSLDGENEDEDFLSGLDESSKYDSLIHEAESKNDFNLSTRFWYLKTLKNLSDKELIYFSPDKTNKEYVQEMASNIHQKLFASLTRNYEYVWYGKFIIDKIKYEQLKSEFILFNKKV